MKRRLKMPKGACTRGFTLINVVITLSILFIVSTIAAFGYSEVVNRSYQKVCETNLEVLTTAVEFYSMENDALPATLGDLERKHLDRAYAKVVEEDYWGVKLAGLVAAHSPTGIAHAQFLTYENLRQLAIKENFKDPADANGGVSYGINNGLAGRRWQDVGANEIVVADADIYVFYDQTQFSRRHTRDLGTEHFAIAMTKGKELVEMSGTAGTAHTPTNLSEATIYFDDMVIKNLHTAVADKAEDVRNKLLSAQTELSNSSDIQAAKASIEGAQTGLQAMIDEGLIGQVEGIGLMNLLQRISDSL